MKKFKHFVFGGIENKLFNLILICVIVITATGFLVTNYQNNVLSQLTAETSVRQRETIGEITDSVMDQVIDQNMDRIIEMEAYIADEMFRELRNRVQIMADTPFPCSGTRRLSGPGRTGCRTPRWKGS